MAVLGALLALVSIAPATGSGARRGQATALETIGRSVQGRAIQVKRRGDEDAARNVVVFACVHGDECAGRAVAASLRRIKPPSGLAVWIVRDLNPDGRAAGTRENARGVDLNRNFPVGFRRHGRRGDAEYSGPRPFSEPESRAARRLIERVRPDVTVWYHQPFGLVDRSGGDARVERRYARLARLPLVRLAPLPGTATRWQNRRFPGTTAFVVELTAGRLAPEVARRHAGAVLAVSAAP